MKIMAFDFGLKRIGVAIGDTEIKIPHPLTTISGKNKKDKLEQIIKLVNYWQPVHFVVGLPSFSEDKVELLGAIKNFSCDLIKTFNYKVDFVNEDDTSIMASLDLNMANIYGKKQRNKIDSLAACWILTEYFSINS